MDNSILASIMGSPYFGTLPYHLWDLRDVAIMRIVREPYQGTCKANVGTISNASREPTPRAQEPNHHMSYGLKSEYPLEYPHTPYIIPYPLKRV